MTIPNIWYVSCVYLVLLRNSWHDLWLVRGMTRDASMYPEPEVFRPERFLDVATVDPRNMVFGFGRR